MEGRKEGEVEVIHEGCELGLDVMINSWVYRRLIAGEMSVG